MGRKRNEFTTSRGGNLRLSVGNENRGKVEIIGISIIVGGLYNIW